MTSMTDMFRHHGFWSIGVRMFRNMTFMSKAAIISAVFMLVVAQLAFIFIRASNQAIHASERELVGVAHVRELVALIGQAQALRRSVLEAGGQSTPAVAEQLGKVEHQLAALDARFAAEPALADAFKFARDAFAPLKTPAGDREEAFSRADEFVQQVLRLTATAADTTSLSQDPDPDSYHLMLASTQETLQATRLLGRLRDLGADAIATTTLSPFQRRIVHGDAYVMYTQLELLFARYERVVKANPALDAPLAFQDAFKPVNTFMRALRRGPMAEAGPVGDAAAFATAGQAAIESLSALTERSHTALAGLIETRIGAQQRARNVQLALAFGGLLIAAYFFHCFYLVTRGGMREVTRHIDAMARGDLSTQPRPWGRDEAAAVMHSIGAMQHSLRALIGQVRGCAEVIVRSSSEVSAGADDLSERTEQAASSLQQTASAMEQIATTVKHTAARTDESAALGRDNARVAGEGGEVVARVVATMQDIEASSKKIGEIIGVIDTIAFQTNILALNAAVEAARAAVAEREIKGLIAASAEHTAHGTRIVRTAGDTMGQLVRNAQAMSGLLAEVSTAASEQTRGVGEVTSAVARLDHDTQRNAALVEQTTAAALSMKRKADELASAADRFVLA